jgi:hypothetical protein
MIDDEEAELRKEQLRLQNLALAQQLADRARAEQRAEATKQLAKDVGKAGVALAKLVGIGVAAIVGLLVLLLAITWYRESSEREEKRARETEEALAECKKFGGKVRVFLTLPDGTHGSVDEDDFAQMPHGTLRGKKCHEVMAGEYPY